MKKRYLREAYLLDDGILLHGKKDKRGFHPYKGLPCGFGTQSIRRKDIGKTLFLSLSKAKETLGSINLAGGKAIIVIDDGMVVTKMTCLIGDILINYKTDTIFDKENVRDLIKECLLSQGITLNSTTVVYAIHSENTLFSLNGKKHQITM